MTTFEIPTVTTERLRLRAFRASDLDAYSAMQAKPDWLLTHNTKHFTPQVSKRTGLQIGTPADFFRQLSQGITLVATFDQE